MNKETEHLRLLAIFHYVVAGLAALFSLFPLIYTTVGAIFIFVARHGTPKPGEELPPELLGWIFVGIGSLLFLVGIAMAICILMAGRSLALRRRYSFALVLACVECFFVPFGTISRSLYDRCSFARVGPGIIPQGNSAISALKLRSGFGD